MQNFKEKVTKDKSDANRKALGKGNEGFLEKIQGFFNNQIKLFRFAFGSIPTTLAIDVLIKIRSDEPIVWETLAPKLLIWFIFGLGFVVTYKIEHWDESIKAINENRKKEIEKKFEYVDRLNDYTLREWIPEIDDHETKIEIFQALGKMVNMINIGDIKEDMAQLHSSLAESLSLFLNAFTDMKKEFMEQMKNMVPKRLQKNVTEEELEKAIIESTKLEKKQ